MNILRSLRVRFVAVSSSALVAILGCGTDGPVPTPPTAVDNAAILSHAPAVNQTQVGQLAVKASAATNLIDFYDYAQSPARSNSGWASSFNMILQLANDAKMISNKSVSAVAGDISGVISVLQLAGVLPKSDEVLNLEKDLNSIGNGLSWQDLQIYVDDQYKDIVSAVEQLSTDPGSVYSGGPFDQASSSAVSGLEEAGAWSRAPIGSGNDSSTDGQWMYYPRYWAYDGSIGAYGPSGDTVDRFPPIDNVLRWKDVISARPAPGETVFDWRMGAPTLLKAIAGRLLVIANIDPNFRTDHVYDTYIEDMRSNLVSYYQTMNSGVTCGYSTEQFSSTYAPTNHTGLPTNSADECVIICADIYTGTASMSVVTPPTPTSQFSAGTYNWPNAGGSSLDSSASCERAQGGSAFTDAYNMASYQVRSQMPLFQMQAMIDLLATFLHPGADLTQTFGRISEQGQQNTCLTLPGSQPGGGTVLEAQACDGSPNQQWTYNRLTGQIKNPNYGLCVDIQWANPLPQTPVWAWPCTAPSGDVQVVDNPAQVWTYDPLQHVLLNQMGVVLGTNDQSVVLTAPGPGVGGLILPTVGTYPYPQEWHADGYVKGDMTGDGTTDIILVGPSWSSFPIAASQANGIFNVSLSSTDDDLFGWAAGQPGARPVPGDFDGDGLSEVALTGGAGWASIPIAFHTAGGTLHVTNATNDDTSNFAYWASLPGCLVVPGDFNGDGRTDIALTGGSGWTSIPIAFSNGDGSFHVTNTSANFFAGYAALTGAQAVPGDFNGDGLADIALVGETSGNLVLIATSNGDGSFTVNTSAVTAGDTNFTVYAASPGVKAVSGDFNGDGRSDIALTGGSGWWTIPVALTINGGKFNCANYDLTWGDTNFPFYATLAGVQAVAGDFNHDGKSDIALTGGSGWWTIPVAFSNGDGTFGVANNSLGGDGDSDNQYLNLVSSPGSMAAGGY